MIPTRTHYPTPKAKPLAAPLVAVQNQYETIRDMRAEGERRVAEYWSKSRAREQKAGWALPPIYTFPAEPSDFVHHYSRHCQCGNCIAWRRAHVAWRPRS